MNGASITAVVTCHNYARYLAACLESLLRQTLPFYEIILIDDASGDFTPSVAARYAERGVRYERVEFRNVARARQRGVELSSGDFIVCIDADDWVLPVFNEEMIRPLLEDPSLTLTYSSWIFLKENEQASAYLKIQRVLYPLFKYVPRLLRRFNYIDNCAMIRRSAWLGQDPSLSGHLEDWDHWLRVLGRGGKAKLVPRRLLYYRLHDRPGGSENYIARKDEARREIAQRHRYREDVLTAVFFFQKELPSEDPFWQDLRALRVSGPVQFLFIDQTCSAEFHRRLKALSAENPGSQAVAFPHPPAQVPSFFRGGQADAESRALRRAWHFSKHFIEGRRVFAGKAGQPLPADAVEIFSSRLTGSDAVWSEDPRWILGDAFVLEKLGSFDGNMEKSAGQNGWRFMKVSLAASMPLKGESLPAVSGLEKAPRRKSSAVVTCRNYGRFVSRALDSLLEQTLPFDEIILVDDGSRDETRAVWEAKYAGRVRYQLVHFQDQHKSRTAGLEASSGDYVAFLDGDDWALPLFHERLRARLEQDPRAGLAFGHCERVLEDVRGRWFPEPVRIPEERWFEPFQYYFNHVLSAFLVRREAWPGGGNFGVPIPGGSRYGEDWEATLVMLGRGWGLANVPEKLFCYRIHETNVTRSFLSLDNSAEASASLIRQRQLPYDLTILVYVRPDLYYRDALLKELQAMAPRLKKQILIVDGSGHGGRVADLLPHAQYVFRYDRTFSGDPEWKWAAFQTFYPYALGRCVLLWDPRYAVPEGSVEKLLGALESACLPFASARAEGAVSAGLVSGEALFDDPALLLMDCAALDAIPAASRRDPASLLQTLAWWIRRREGDRAIRSDVVVRDRAFRLKVPERGDPPVSIVIPVRNDARRLSILLDSLRTLDYPAGRTEVIVVDNGSSDGTIAAAEKYPEVKVLIETKPGSYAARNRGLREARHKLIAFLDSDCAVNSRWLRELVDALEEDALIGAVAGDNEPVDERAFWSRYERACRGYQNFSGEGVRAPFGITMNILYRREVFDTCGHFDDSRLSGSDVEMTWRMQQGGQWRLKVLKGSGLVRHFDVSSFRAWKRRHERIGGGHFSHYEQYPPRLEEHYRWLPLSRAEILVQTFLQVPAVLKAGFKKPLRLLGLFSLLRKMFQKLGYLAALRQSGLLGRRAPAARGFVFFGAEHCQAWAPFFPPLDRLGARGREEVSVLAVDSRARVGKSWFCFVRGLLGGTNLWRWPGGVRSLELWEIFPERFGSERFVRWNRRLNLARIRRALGLRPGAPLSVDGWIPRTDLLAWCRDLQVPRPADVPELALARHLAPCAACLLDGWDSEIDWDELLRVSANAFWPVVVLVRGRPESRDSFFPRDFEPARLTLIFTEDFEMAAALIGAKALMLFYPFKKEAGARRVLPEAALGWVKDGMPVVSNRPDKTGVPSAAGLFDGETADLLRQVCRLQQMPVWTHASKTPAAVYGRETSAEVFSASRQ